MCQDLITLIFRLYCTMELTTLKGPVQVWIRTHVVNLCFNLLSLRNNHFNVQKQNIYWKPYNRPATLILIKTMLSKKKL